MNIALRSAWLAALLACCACGSSPNTAFYSLAAVSGTARDAALGAVEVRRPSIAGYLDRAEILGPWDGQRLQPIPSTSWGEPIAQMIGRVLAEDLTHRLHGTIVFNASPGLSLQADAVIELAVWKFDLDRDGLVRLDSLASLRWQHGQAPTSTRTIALQARPAALTTDAVVSAMSSLLGQLADELAAALVARPHGE